MKRILFISISDMYIKYMSNKEKKQEKGNKIRGKK